MQHYASAARGYVTLGNALVRHQKASHGVLFGADIKLAGSLPFAVSLPTMIVGFTRCSQNRSFAVLGQSRRFVLVMAAGSIVGAFIGGQLLGLVPMQILLPLFAAILLISAVKVWQH